MNADKTSNERCFQLRVWDWMLQCFTRPDARSKEQRAFRFIEEALELVQAVGTSREDVLRLVEYVYSRPVGHDAQEVGGVMVTLAALSQSCVLDMQAWGEEELRRCIRNTERIRAKDLAKPQRSPLPGISQSETSGELALTRTALSNLLVAIKRHRCGVRTEPDVQFAIDEAARLLGGPHMPQVKASELCEFRPMGPNGELLPPEKT